MSSTIDFRLIRQLWMFLAVAEEHRHQFRERLEAVRGRVAGGAA